MVKEIFEAILNFLRSRMFILMLVFILMFTTLIFRVFNLQIVNEEYYLNNYIQTAKKEVLTSGTRGLIYDRYGNVLAYNKLAYAVEIEDVLDSSIDKNEKLNKIIDETVKIIQKNSDTIINDFKIILNSAGEYEYSVSSENEKKRFLRDIYGVKRVEDLDTEEHTYSTSTAEETMKYICETKYKISDEYDKSEKLYITMIRFNLSANSYQKYISTKIASNVSQETVAAIYECSNELEGVSIAEETIRVYNDAECFSHIIGYTGKISEEQMAELNSDDGNYINSDMVGKSGIEAEMEKELQGTKGKDTIFVDNTGRVIEVIDSEDAKSGNDVYLTLDAKLQKAGYTILEQKLAGILYNKIVNYDYVAEENAKEIFIPVKDVYFQMINNNVLDLSKFGLESATENEHRIFNTFNEKKANVVAAVYGELTSQTPHTMTDLSDEFKEYMEYIYSLLLSKEKVLVSTNIDYEDEVYLAWQTETISLQQFLYHAISKNWINTSKLYPNGETKYSDTDEIYAVLVNYIKTKLENDTGFFKKMYYYLIYNGNISGNQICMALFDQGVLEANEVMYTSLASGSSAFDFIKEMVRTIKITPAQIALDPCSGSIAVTDVSTGDVLALVTYPSYDNNMLSGSVDSVYWNKINNDLSLPLYNRATQTRTAPGSTFKMVTSITGLEEGYISPSTTIVDKGQFTQVTPSPKCWKFPGNHGAENVSTALRDSCNYFFYDLAYNMSLDSTGKFVSSLGLAKMKKYADLLGLTSLSGVEIEENEPLYSTDNSVRSAIGQGSNSYSNIQLARYITTLANGGNNYKLTLIEKVVDTDTKAENIFAPVLENTINLQNSTWDAVYTGMRLVCTDGTAKTVFKDFKIAVAGKSGTAQENKLRSNHSVFVAYAPYDKPEIAVSVLLPNGESSGYTAEIVRETIKYYYKLTTDAELFGGNAAIPTTGITGD